MVDRKSKKISVIIFLFAIFVLLVAFSASWIYKIYKEQTAFSEQNTLSTVECSKYYYFIDPDAVEYYNGTLSFNIKNTLGREIETIVVESASETKEFNIYLGQGMTQPVSSDFIIDGWFLVYPKDCRNVNFRNISFEPNLE